MTWQTPKTNWQAADVVSKDDFNRIEGNIQELQNTKETPASAQAKAEAAAGAVQAELNTHKADYVRQPGYANATGTNAKTITLNPAPGAYIDGMAISFKNATQNTGAVTLNVNGLGAKSVVKPNGSVLKSGNLKANSVYTVRYNGTNFILQGSDSAGDAAPGDVLTGKTFSNDEDIEITGTMPNRGAVNHTLAINGTYTIPAGYHNGAGKVTQSIIKSIQKGLIAISTGTTATATIANINPNNALLFYVGATEGWATTTMMPYLELVNSTTVRATRYENLAELTTVSFLVVEFQSALKSVQRGVIQIPPSVKTSTATIASVDVNKALLFFLGYAESFGRTSYAPYLELVNSTTVRATRYGFSSESYALSKVSYQIVEF